MSAAKFFIPGLPGQPSSSLSMYGGLIPAAPALNGVVDTASDEHLYFYFVKNRHISDKPRCVPPHASSALTVQASHLHQRRPRLQQL